MNTLTISQNIPDTSLQALPSQPNVIQQGIALHQRDALIPSVRDYLRDVLCNPNATPEERRIADAYLSETTGP